MNTRKIGEHFLFATILHPPLLLLTTVEGHHQVVLFAAAQWVVHQMTMRSGPQYRRVNAQLFRHIIAINHGAIDHVPGNPRSIANQRLTNNRFYTVTAHQNICRPAVAVLVKYRHVILCLANINHVS